MQYMLLFYPAPAEFERRDDASALGG